MPDPSPDRAFSRRRLIGFGSAATRLFLGAVARFEVVNERVVALTSSRLADLLPGRLQTWRPDGVALLSGCNDSWNVANRDLRQLGIDDGPALLAALHRLRVDDVLGLERRHHRRPIGIVAPPTPLRGRTALPADLAPPVDGTARTHARRPRLFEDAVALDEQDRYESRLPLGRSRAAGTQVLLPTYPFAPDGFDPRVITRDFPTVDGLHRADVRGGSEALARTGPDPDPFSADRGHQATGAPRGHVEVERQRCDDARAPWERDDTLGVGAPRVTPSLAWLYARTGDVAALEQRAGRAAALPGDGSDIEDILEAVDAARRADGRR